MNDGGERARESVNERDGGGSGNGEPCGGPAASAPRPDPGGSAAGAGSGGGSSPGAEPNADRRRRLAAFGRVRRLADAVDDAARRRRDRGSPESPSTSDPEEPGRDRGPRAPTGP